MPHRTATIAVSHHQPVGNPDQASHHHAEWEEAKSGLGEPRRQSEAGEQRANGKQWLVTGMVSDESCVMDGSSASAVNAIVPISRRDGSARVMFVPSLSLAGSGV